MNIFVAKLDYDTHVDVVRSLFENFGEVTSCKVIMDRETGKSKGFGFVEMQDDEAANKAIAALNGFELDGRNIVVKQSEDKPGGGGGNRGGGFSRPRTGGGGGYGGGYGGGRRDGGNKSYEKRDDNYRSDRRRDYDND